MSQPDRRLARMMGYGSIYFLTYEGDEHYVKVGSASDPFRRLSDYVTGSWRKPMLLHLVYVRGQEDISHRVQPYARWRSIRRPANPRERLPWRDLEARVHSRLLRAGLGKANEWYVGPPSVIATAQLVFDEYDEYPVCSFGEVKRRIKSRKEELALNAESMSRAEKSRLYMQSGEWLSHQERKGSL